MVDENKNKYCKRSDLVNEASVEQFFIIRLLGDLGYKDEEIKPKESISELTISLGRKKELYKPDYVLMISEKPRWLIDAKSPTEEVDKWIGQCSGYALTLNRKYTEENPLKYYVITNGIIFKLFKWDDENPILTMNFSEFHEDNDKFQNMKSILNAKVVRENWEAVQNPKHELIVLKRPTIDKVKKLFNSCHRVIWNIESMSPSPAFFEFVKIMFVKLWEDKKLHDDPNIGPLIERGEAIPKDRIRFSTKWIESQDTENPINSILFNELNRKLEESIKRNAKKRIFSEGEDIRLNSATVKEVVLKMENYDLFGIDEDLNGRLFETFLNATMRGKELGQFFTPRSIVKLMTKLASPKATRDHIDRVLDGCCGTGGFLIELLTEMRNQVRDNKSLASNEKDKLLSLISNESIFGMDAGKEPPIARIARINMYLHGDGGSRIYSTDGLDKSIAIPDGINPEQKIELEELQSLLLDKKLKFDIILTNPPFAKDYSEKLPNQKRVMEEYDLYKYGVEDTSKHRSTLRSSVMFLERYSDLLETGDEAGNKPGKLLTVMDDSILSGKKYRWARKFIRDKFIIRAVISLPGDAFQRAGARSKTSILFLTPRAKGDKSQPDVFMTESMYIGLDDVVQKTPPSKVLEAKTLAENEISRILDDFNKYLDGVKGDWLVSSDRIKDRLDAKFCLPRKNDITDEWKDDGLNVLTLADVVVPVDNEINVSNLSGKITLLKITYDGLPERGETHLVSEVSYKKLYKIEKDDIAISNIAAAYGSVAVIPEDFTDLFVSSEYTILRIKDKRFYPYFLWGYLRSPEICARMLSNSTGISRHRVAWDEQRNDGKDEVGTYLKDLPVPYISDDSQKGIAEHYKTAIENIRKASLEREGGDSSLNSILDLNNEWAVNRLRAAKPPK